MEMTPSVWSKFLGCVETKDDPVFGAGMGTPYTRALGQIQSGY